MSAHLGDGAPTGLSFQVPCRQTMRRPASLGFGRRLCPTSEGDNQVSDYNESETFVLLIYLEVRRRECVNTRLQTVLPLSSASHSDSTSQCKAATLFGFWALAEAAAHNEPVEVQRSVSAWLHSTDGTKRYCVRAAKNK